MKRFRIWMLLCPLVAVPLVSGGLRAADSGRSVRVVPTSGPLAGKQLYANSFALVVGVNKYPGLDNKDLRYAVPDARDMRDVLVKYYGFPAENVTLLLDEQATRAAIEKAVSALLNKRKVGPDDRVLIFFSGHGQTVKLPGGGEQGFLIPYDGEVDLKDFENIAPYADTCVSMRTVWDRVEACPAKHVLVMADACYSGLLATRKLENEQIQPDALARLWALRAMQVMTAGGAGEESVEMPNLGHGAFTFKVLEQLRARATTPGSVFLAQELYRDVYRAVLNLTGGKQKPQMKAYQSEGEFFFIPTGSAAPAPPPITPGPAVSGGGDGAEMVPIPAGEFTMGSNDGMDDEKPPHKVNLPAFSIDRYEVTNAQYAGFLNASGGKTQDAAGHEMLQLQPAKVGDRTMGIQLEQAGGQWRPKPGMAKHPVVMVTWYGAAAYAKWAGKRLPAEAEWEKAARGSDGRTYPWGNEWDPQKPNTSEGGPKRAAPVGSYPGDASVYGVMDMAGNVGEWTSTVYAPYPYAADDGREDAASDKPRVVRGGGWDFYRGPARASLRSRFSAGGWALDTLGFRCARPVQ